MKEPARRRHIYPSFSQNSQKLNDVKIFNTLTLSQKKQISFLSLMFITSIILIIAGTAVSKQKNPLKDKAVQSVSTLAIDPTDTPSPTVPLEPFITAWRTYSNDTFNFTITIPKDWNTQDYTIPAGGTIIAFSPDALPCNTCTYFRDGYLSIKIFNQKTDPVAYANFVQKINSLGKKKEYLQIKIDRVNGVYAENTAAVENQGWVYEIAFDKDKGNAKAPESELFQKILASFTFTGLAFDK